jgi:hypothetical protein
MGTLPIEVAFSPILQVTIMKHPVNQVGGITKTLQRHDSEVDQIDLHKQKTPVSKPKTGVYEAFSSADRLSASADP